MNPEHRCRFCNSPDTVSYWAIKGNRDDDQPTSMLRSMIQASRENYPNARKCVDCGEVWW